MKSKLILILSFCCLTVFARTKLYEFKKEILSLGAKIKTLEKDIGSKNTLYLQKLELAESLEEGIEDVQAKIKLSQSELSQRKNKINHILRSMAISNLEDEVRPTEDYFHVLQVEKHQIEAKMDENKLFEEQLKNKQAELDRIRSDSRELLFTLREVEAEKNRLTDKYLTQVEKKNARELSLQKQKLQSKLSAIRKIDLNSIEKPELKLSLPLNDYTQIVPTSKGITLNFNAAQPLLNPSHGKVIYHGELASYGKVLMIDHGQDLRSVILGHFESQLARGDVISSGQPIGFVKPQNSTSLYFEIRKKNIAQKTIHWIDEKSLSKI